LIGLKFPIYLAPHPDKVLWILHQHRTAYDLWDHPEHGDPDHLAQRASRSRGGAFADTRFIPEAGLSMPIRTLPRVWNGINGIAARPLLSSSGEPSIWARQRGLFVLSQSDHAVSARRW
jgi:hypothetical protein